MYKNSCQQLYLYETCQTVGSVAARLSCIVTTALFSAFPHGEAVLFVLDFC